MTNNPTQVESVEGLAEDEAIGLAVWCVSIADHHADVLTPRMVEKLYAASDALRSITQQAEEVARLRETLERAAIRFAHLAGQIEAGFNISGTLRAEQAMKARHMSDEARAALNAHSGGEGAE